MLLDIPSISILQAGFRSSVFSLAITLQQFATKQTVTLQKARGNSKGLSMEILVQIEHFQATFEESRDFQVASKRVKEKSNV